MSDAATVVLSRCWDQGGELAFVTRCLAGAATRCGTVSVHVEGGPGASRADGAFDLEPLGEAGDLRWPAAVGSGVTTIVDELTSEIAELLRRAGVPRVYYLSVGSGAQVDDPSHPAGWQRLHLVGGGPPAVDLHVPVNPLAGLHRHHGFGFTDYLLVLSDRTRHADDPPPAVAWLSAAFANADVVLVEEAVAYAWKGRALRGSTSVDTRMDLWRLLAHAAACVDLSPGPHIARECVEALRLGTPIIVPAGTPAGAVHARRSGGAEFRDEGELVQAAARLQGAQRGPSAARARRYGDDTYGDPERVVGQVRQLLRGPESLRPQHPVLA
jgi:hypothetical protein